MKTAKEENAREGAVTNSTAKKAGNNGQLRTDHPLIEKDGVKQVEANLRKSRRAIL
jgi:hypothetical protein